MIATECKQHITPCCSESTSARNVFYSVLTTMAFVGVFCSVSHAFLGGFRLRRRADMILTIDQGCAHQLFSDIDTDSNGKITRDELSDFLAANGLESQDPDLFMQAYDTLAGQHGGLKGVGTTELVQQFSQLIASITQEKAEGPQKRLPEDVITEVKKNPIGKRVVSDFDEDLQEASSAWDQRQAPEKKYLDRGEIQLRQLKEQEMGPTICS
eukprot:TRINITY_DN7007_c0_g2_i3.p2 TRINITY_DN7007_c0_g2~~TRINITY_DN7007_c0_g2_i3.p2  ORF type:complete len:212 (-),score=54.69 TRINITY_DN7007_c0_g2_i3:258-893(-)